MAGQKRTRAHQPSNSEDADVGPLPPVEDDSDDEDVGPAPPPLEGQEDQDGSRTTAALASSKKKRRRVLPAEALYLKHLPSASRYYKSFMHRDPVCRADVTPHPTNFVITASIDGHVKFWKKQEEGIEFVKHYRAHLGPIVGTSVSADGALYASISTDGSVKVFDVANFDMINMINLSFTPRACCWVHKRGKASTILAISEEGSNKIHLFDGKGEDTPSATIESVHRKPCHLIVYNERYDTVLSADISGLIEYWRPEEPYQQPKDVPRIWTYKSDTDLLDFKKSKSVPCSFRLSPDGSRFSAMSLPDRQMRLFSFASGKLLRKYDESLRAMQEMQQAGTAVYTLDEMEFGRRLAMEKDLDAGVGIVHGKVQEGASLFESGAQHATGLATANAIFDESGNFLLYATMLGIKIVNLTNNKVSVILGRDEATRFLHLSLFQGAATKKAMTSIALAASENPLAQTTETIDPTLFCTAHKRARFYLFTRNEPENDPKSKANGGERDVFNEKPTREEVALAAASSEGVSKRAARPAIASGAVLHTTLGDIHLRLFPDQVHKTVENFVGLARKGYYDGTLFHRVIHKFMLQCGDPLGDGTGGESLWGKEFEDEFRKDLKHDRPYTISMANAGPNTNGSQFFITTVPTPWLDNRHTVFGRAVSGMDVIHQIENTKVDKNDKPRQDIKILNISIQD